MQRSALCRSRRELSICLENLASIQPRTSPVKFARSPRTDPPTCGATPSVRAAAPAAGAIMMSKIEMTIFWTVFQKRLRRFSFKIEGLFSNVLNIRLKFYETIST